MKTDTNICFFADNDGAPEPPVRYNPNNTPNLPTPQGPQGPQGSHEPFQDELSRRQFISARRYVSISQVLALVSLLIGGMVLSGISLVVAIIGRRKAASGVVTYQGQPIWSALYRSSFIAIVLCLIAFALNLAALVFLYPLLMDMFQMGDYGSLFGFDQGGSTVAPGSGSSTWG